MCDRVWILEPWNRLDGIMKCVTSLKPQGVKMHGPETSGRRLRGHELL